MNDLRIVKILNNREVAVSGSPPLDIEDGDILRILAQPITIEDPDTGESLGEIVNTKAVVRVYDVQERFVLARTFRQRKVNVGGTGTAAFGRIFEPPKYEVRTETLQRDPSKDQSLRPEESIVEVGDRVEKYDGELDDVPSSTVWK